MNMKVHFSSKKQDWETPESVFNSIKAEFYPTVDVCATADNRKCFAWFGYDKDGKFTDGLLQDWNIDEGGKHTTVCWMNPPYGREIGKWVKKAYEESQKGCTVVALLPSRTDTKYFHDWIYNKPTVEIRFLRGRVKFVGANSSAPFPSMIVIFKAV